MNDKELLNLIKQRRSVRKYKSIPVNKKNILEIIEAGTYAPSGSNTQCYRFIIINNKKELNFLSKTKLKWISTAPCAILVYADLSICSYLKSSRKEVFDKLPYQDCAMAMQNMILLAEYKGLNTCVIHLSEQWKTAKEIKNYFNLSNKDELMGLITIGYKDENINYENKKHADRKIKRKPVEHYIIK